MKTLLLLRHAKSSKDDPLLKDFDRPLNERGTNDAKLIGKFLKKKKISPGLILSSPAKRARQTAELFTLASGLKTEPTYDQRIYESSVRRLLEVLAEVQDTVPTVVLVGHNPEFEELCESLTGEAHRLPTAALSCIELRLQKWSRVRPGIGRLKWRMKPKKLKSK
jgi:phosphohistidine phosphatase